MIEKILPARVKHGVSFLLYRNRSVSIEFDFIEPLLAFGKLCYRKAFHRFDEGCDFRWKRDQSFWCGLEHLAVLLSSSFTARPLEITALLEEINAA